MIAPMRWQAISSTFHRTHFPPTACFHPKVTFSAISNGNQALNQPKRYHDHWKLFKGDLWWPPFGSKPFWAHSTTPPFHPKPVSNQKLHYQLFQKGIKLWLSQKGIMTIGNCSRVTYDGSHAVASHFEHIPPHPLSTHSLFSPKNYIFSYLKNSKPFWAHSNPFPPFLPTSQPVFTQKLHWNSWKCNFWVETGCGWKGVAVECALNYLPPHGGYHRSP